MEPRSRCVTPDAARVHETRNARDMKNYKYVLIATDGSELAEKGLAHGLALAKPFDAKVTVLTVTEPLQPEAARAAVKAGVEDPVSLYDLQIDEKMKKRFTLLQQPRSMISSSILCMISMIFLPMASSGQPSSGIAVSLSCPLMAGAERRGCFSVARPRECWRTRRSRCS